MKPKPFSVTIRLIVPFIDIEAMLSPLPPLRLTRRAGSWQPARSRGRDGRVRAVVAPQIKHRIGFGSADQPRRGPPAFRAYLTVGGRRAGPASYRTRVTVLRIQLIALARGHQYLHCSGLRTGLTSFTVTVCSMAASMVCNTEQSETFPPDTISKRVSNGTASGHRQRLDPGRGRRGG